MNATTTGTKGSKGETARILNLVRLGALKELPVDYLRSIGLADSPGGVRIPYVDLESKTMFFKTRTALKARDGSYWPAGTPLCAYGQDHLATARSQGCLILVEGESDCWALWRHGKPALGIPGACATKTLRAAFFNEVTEVYIHREPDKGGEVFLRSVLEQLAAFAFAGEVRELTLPGFKDPADMHAADPIGFPARLKEAMSRGRLLTLPPVSRTQGGQGLLAPLNSRSPAAFPDTPVADVGVSLADVTRQKVTWLWPGRIPLGKLTVLDGDPGLGKSTLVLDLAARLTRGLAMPLAEEALPAAGVILLSAEDGLNDTLRPRLESAGADLSRVIAMPSVPGPDGPEPVTLPRDVYHLRALILKHKARLVIIDPLMAFLGGHVNAHNDQNSRRALLPLAQLAEELGVAIVVIRHLNKQPGGNPLYRGGGSIGIIGAARSGLLVARDPDDHDRRLLAVTKSNLSRLPVTLQFSLEDDEAGLKVHWTGESKHGADALLQPSDAEDGPALAEACEFLNSVLAAGPMPAQELQTQAAQLGIVLRTLKRAKRRLSIASTFHSHGYKAGGEWSWQLAHSAPPAPGH